jgi:hypothetical protein
MKYWYKIILDGNPRKISILQFMTAKFVWEKKFPSLYEGEGQWHCSFNTWLAYKLLDFNI